MADKPLVLIVLGSKTDEPVTIEAEQLLTELGIPFHKVISSAHRNPERAVSQAATARELGFKVLIGIAGLGAALPGTLAANTTLPVIGVPINAQNSLQGGMDAVGAILQMPPGIPVACVGINNARNAALLAAAILALTDPMIQTSIEKYRAKWNT